MDYSWNCADCSSSSIPDEFYHDRHNHPATHDFIRWKSGKRVDPRVLFLLEQFGEIYMNRKEFFKKIFGENHDELFRKVSQAMKKKKRMRKALSMPRSSSTGGMKVAMNQRGFGTDEMGMAEVRLARFRVRAPNVIVVGPQDGQQGQDGEPLWEVK